MAVLLSIQRRLILSLSGRFLSNFKILEVPPTAPQSISTRASQLVRQHNISSPQCRPCRRTGHCKSTRSISTSIRLFGKETIVCPAFAESVSEGDIQWIKRVGDKVAVDDKVAEIQTDKTVVDVNSPYAGVIISIEGEDGSSVKPKQPLCVIDDSAGEGPAATPATDDASPSPPPPPSSPPSAPASLDSQEATSPPPSPATPLPSPTTPPPIPSPPTSPMSTVPVSDVPVTPPGDSESSAVSRGPRTEDRVKLSRMRLRIAARLKESQNTCAMLTTFNEVDMSNLMALRERYKDKFLKNHGLKLGFMSAFIKASAYALQGEPSVNAVIDDKDIVYRNYVDISVAVATPKGLLVPVLRNVETMNYTDIEKAIHELGEKARTGSLAVEDMDGGTFTVSNGGVFGSMFGTPIINPPQSAILGMHGIFNRPVAISSKVEIRPMMYIALTYDHRLIDGREAVFFLRKIKSAVEDPAVMLLDL